MLGSIAHIKVSGRDGDLGNLPLIGILAQSVF